MLVEDYLEEALSYPDSYEAIDIYVDSAFAPYDDRKAFEMLNIIGELAEDLAKLGEEIGVVIRCQHEDIFNMMHRI